MANKLTVSSSHSSLSEIFSHLELDKFRVTVRACDQKQNFNNTKPWIHVHGILNNYP